MKNTFLILISFISFNSFAQEKEFTLSKEHSLELQKSYGISFPDVFKLLPKEINLQKFDKIKTKTKEYIQELKENETIKADSINARKEYLNSLKTYETFSDIEENIKNFLNSKGRFKERKKHLITAQLLSDSLDSHSKSLLYKSVPSNNVYHGDINLENVIYADENINSSFKSKFKKIRFVLKQHLSSIIKNTNNIKKPRFIWQRPYNYSRYRNKSIEKYNYSFVANGEINIAGYKVLKPEVLFSELIGDFKILYNKNDFVGDLENNKMALNSVLEGIDLKNNKLEEFYNGYIFQNLYTKEVYFSKDKSVIENYSISTDLKNIYESLKKRGYITKQIESNTYIIISNKKIRISENEVLLEKIRLNDYGYIEKVSKSIDEFNQKVKLSKPLIIKLNNHIRAYRSKLITAERLKSWKTENKKGKLLVNQFKKIIEAFEVDYLHHYLSSESIQTKTDLQNSVLASDLILGM